MVYWEAKVYSECLKLCLTLDREWQPREMRLPFFFINRCGVCRVNYTNAQFDAFSDSTSKVKPLQVVFMKRKGRALIVDVATGAKDNRQLNVILSYLDADPV